MSVAKLTSDGDGFKLSTEQAKASTERQRVSSLYQARWAAEMIHYFPSPPGTKSI